MQLFTPVGTGFVAWPPTVMALVVSKLPLVELTTMAVVAPVSAVWRVPVANETAWETATPTLCAPKSVGVMVSVVSLAALPNFPDGHASFTMQEDFWAFASSPAPHGVHAVPVKPITLLTVLPGQSEQAWEKKDP
jgi:hypothetical protein